MQSPPSTDVAVIGAGAMGSAIARRLIAVGRRVIVWNRTPEKTLRLTRLGAGAAETPADAAARAGLVLTCLADPPAVIEVITRRDGLLAGIRPDALVVDTSTVDPATSRSIASLTAEAGGRFIDAPVGGSSEVAARGELVVMVGGEDTDVDDALPLFDAISSRVIRCGPVGSGSGAKLALNALLGTLTHSIAEAFNLGVALGLDRETVLDLLATSPAGSQVERKRSRIAGDDYPPSFRLALMRKDLSLAAAAAREAGDPAITGIEAAISALDSAMDAGMGELDYSAVTSWMERLRSTG